MRKRGASRKSVFQDILGGVVSQGATRLPPTDADRIPLDDLRLPERQPRRYFDPGAMSRLVDSVRRHGILQPLLVRPLDDAEAPEKGYELVAGERRYRAAREAGLEEVPAVVREMTVEEAVQYTLLENLQREDLNPIEETEGVLQLLSVHLGRPPTDITSLLYRMQNSARRAARQAPNPGATHNVMGGADEAAVSEVFDSLGTMTWESFVKNRLPLLNLPPDVLDALRSGSIAYTKAKLVARVKDEPRRQALLREAVEQDLPLSELRRRIVSLLADHNGKQAPPPRPSTALSKRASRLASRLDRAGTLEDEAKRRRFEALLDELEALLEG